MNNYYKGGRSEGGRDRYFKLRQPQQQDGMRGFRELNNSKKGVRERRQNESGALKERTSAKRRKKDG